MKFGEGFYGQGKFQPEPTVSTSDWVTVVDNANSFTEGTSEPSNTWLDVV